MHVIPRTKDQCKYWLEQTSISHFPISGSKSKWQIQMELGPERGPASPRAWEFRISTYACFFEMQPSGWRWGPCGSPVPLGCLVSPHHSSTQAWTRVCPVSLPLLRGAIRLRASPGTHAQTRKRGAGRAHAEGRGAGLQGAGLRPRGHLRRRVRGAPQPAAAMPILVKAAVSGELAPAAPPGDPPRARRAAAPRYRRKLGARRPRPAPGHAR